MIDAMVESKPLRSTFSSAVRNRHQQRNSETGAAVTWLVLWLPVLILLLGIVADVGRLYTLRSVAQTAADMGALAGVQELDLEALAEGTLWVNVDEAQREARNLALEVAQKNLDRSVQSVKVESIAINATPLVPATHPWTGRRLETATVSVTVDAVARTYFLSMLMPRVNLGARGDASVLERPGFGP